MRLRARVDLEQVDAVVADDELGVDQAAHAERQHDPRHRRHDRAPGRPRRRVCGGKTPTESPEWTPARSTCSMSPGMSTRSPSRHGVDVDLEALEVAVDADRPVGLDDGRGGQLAGQVGRRVAEVDGQATDDEARPDDDRVADPLGDRQRLLERGAPCRPPAAGCRAGRGAPRSASAPRPGRWSRGRAEQRHAAGGQRRGQVERRLAAELDERREQVAAVGRLGVDHAPARSPRRAARSRAATRRRSRSRPSPGWS